MVSEKENQIGKLSYKLNFHRKKNAKKINQNCRLRALHI